MRLLLRGLRRAAAGAAPALHGLRGALRARLVREEACQSRVQVPAHARVARRVDAQARRDARRRLRVERNRHGQREGAGEAAASCVAKDPDRAAQPYMNMANVYMEQEDYGKSLEYHRKALAINDRVHGPRHPDTAKSHHGMGIVFKQQGGRSFCPLLKRSSRPVPKAEDKTDELEEPYSDVPKLLAAEQVPWLFP